MTSYPLQKYWETTLPTLYDVWYGWHRKDQPARFVTDILAELGVLKKETEHELHILDCACGTGNPSLALLEMGINVTSSDGSSTMLEFARKHALEMGLHDKFRCHQIIWSELATVLSPKRYDAVICTGNSICHVPPSGVRDAVENMFKVLRPGGACIIDIKRYSERIREIHFDKVHGWVELDIRRVGPRQLADGRISEFTTTLIYNNKDVPGRTYDIALELRFDDSKYKRYVFPVWAITSEMVLGCMRDAGLHVFPLKITPNPQKWKYDFCIGQRRL